MTSTPPSTPDFALVKARQQENWAAGDYAYVGRTAVIPCELLCEAVDLRAGQKVLDVATGSGNAAIAAARRYCDVTGIDYVPALLEVARRRAEVERFEISFVDGDAEAIPFPDAAFDVVLSTFGSQFAPNQELAAAELLRVCRSGGKIGLTNWTPESLVGDFFQAVMKRWPLPPFVKPPVLWGTETRLRELFGDGISALQTTERSFVHRYRSARHYVESFQTYFGPAKMAFDRLSPADRESLTDEMVASLERHNISGDDTLVAPSAYLEVVAVRR